MRGFLLVRWWMRRFHSCTYTVYIIIKLCPNIYPPPRCWCWGWSPVRCRTMNVIQRYPTTAPIGIQTWIVISFWQRYAWPPSTRSWTRGSICSWGRSSCASSASWLTLSPTAPQRIRKRLREHWTLLTNRTKKQNLHKSSPKMYSAFSGNCYLVILKPEELSIRMRRATTREWISLHAGILCSGKHSAACVALIMKWSQVISELLFRI